MKRSRSAFSSMVLAAILILIQSSTSLSKDVWGKVTPEEWALTPPVDYPDAQVVVLVDVCTLRVEPDIIRCERYARLKLFKKEGVEKLNEFGILRHEDDNTVEFKAQTLLPDGKVVKADKKSTFRRSAGNWEVLSIAFPAVEPGCIVELKYVGSHTRFAFLEPWSFQSELNTYLSRMTIVLAPGFEYSALFTNVPANFQTPSKDEIANLDDPENPLHVFTWERTYMPPVDFDEPFAGYKEETQSQLLCQLIKYEWREYFVDFSNSWEKLGKRFFSDKVKPYMYGGNLDKLSERIVIAGEDDLSTMARIYRFVRDSMYLADRTRRDFCNHASIGDFLKTHAGTENDINLLLVALLNEAKIKAQLMLVPSRKENTLLIDAPSLWQFNSSIVLAEFDSSFAVLDPSNKFCTAGRVSPEFLGQQGLAVSEKGSSIINVGAPVGRSYRLDATEMVIDSVGLASCSTAITMTGYFPAYYGRNEGVSSDSFWINYFVLDKIDKNIDATSSDFEFAPDGKLSCWATYSTDLFSRRLENNVFVKPVAIRFSENPFSAIRRSFPIDFQFPGTWHNLVTIRLAKEPTEVSLPGEVSLAINGMTFKRACQRNGLVIIVDSKLIITEPLLEVTEYKDVQKFFEQIATASSDEVSAAF